MKKELQKAWQFIWHDDSWYAWIAQVLIAFIVIKWILYPGIGLIFGTQLPVVAVVSSSMDHQGDFLCSTKTGADWWEVCGQWYSERNITQEQFQEFPLSNGFRKGDVIALRGIDPDNIELGDVIVFQAGKQYPIIHRVIRINEDSFVTKGDNNPEPITQYVVGNSQAVSECFQVFGQTIIATKCTPNSYQVTNETPGAFALLDETNVQPEVIIGKAYGRIPWAGYVKIGFVELLDFAGLDSLARRI